MKKILSYPIIFIAKLWGRVWIFPCLPFRAYARNYVYNYVLQKDKREWLGRLWEREPDKYVDGGLGGWILKDIHGIEYGNAQIIADIEGFISYRKVNTLQFWIVALLWYIWLDDDANEDTTDIGYINSLTGTEYRSGGVDRSKTLAGRIYGRFVPKYKAGEVVFGNAFDLGDVRAEHDHFEFWSTLAWNNRNTAPNLQYLWFGY